VGIDRRVVDHRDPVTGDVVAVGQDALRHMAVGDDVPAEAQRPDEQPRQRLAGPHGADDGGGRQPALDEAGVAIGHPAHAEDQVGRGLGGGPQQPGGEPVEMTVEGLERLEGEGLVLGVVTQPTARPEGEQRHLVPGLGAGGAEEHRLALGASAPQVVLDDEDFHCSARVAANLMIQ